MRESSPPNVAAIDLGAESCRVSLLQWHGDEPRLELVHRFSNAPVECDGSTRWDLDAILAGVDRGLRCCADRSSRPVAAIGVDGWAVDYVRMDAAGAPLAPPFCYRDQRTEATHRSLHESHSAHEVFAQNGVQPLRINTMYQLMADGERESPWLNLPEFVLSQLGGRRCAEYTNATHTGLVEIQQAAWSDTLFAWSGVPIGSAPELVSTGTDLGTLSPGSLCSGLRELPAFANTRLLAVACHDTASAIAGIAIPGPDDWAYISSGTWSLVGTLLDRPNTSPAACDAGFSNMGAAAGRICFHKNVNGMWLLRQTYQHLCSDEGEWPLDDLLEAAAQVPSPDAVLDLADPELLLPGEMATRINCQRAATGLAPIAETAAAMPAFASLIFHSLAATYARVLRDAEQLTGKRLRRIAVVGGGSRNRLLNQLTAEATGLPVIVGGAESSTVGNAAVQLATLEGHTNEAERIADWASRLQDAGAH